MGIGEEKGGESDRKVWSLCKMPFWQTSSNATATTTTSSSSSSSCSSSTSTSSSSMNSIGNNSNVDVSQQNQSLHQLGERSSTTVYSTSTMSFVTKSLLPTRRKLRLDPPNKLYFPCKLVYSFCFQIQTFDLILLFALLFFIWVTLFLSIEMTLSLVDC